MKVSSFSTMIILLTIFSIFFTQPIQCHSPMPDLIEDVCQKTPHYHLCLVTLKSNLYAHHLKSHEDISGFVRIILQVVAARAPVVLEQIQDIYKQTDHTQLKIALDNCITTYSKITKEIIPQALQCNEKSDNVGVKEKVTMAESLAESCEQKCKGTTSSGVSPLGDSSEFVQNMCSIAASIASMPQSKKST
ncbi:cell wall / vacuolar inhibitor of fructosidase 1-like [Vicia villosa]|uniref:cell wall / vacuolar inhibitor of fructosidase 1-like n=1 Tax=Vicia villosa TaxID=3911 RepID=UPI00273C5943|nr:cell wall / vacuolar inhibitor of fructosidase 1-like [Vicia villosa]